MSSAIVQRHLQAILRAAQSTFVPARNAAFEIIGFTVRQGLAHPLAVGAISITLLLQVLFDPIHGNSVYPRSSPSNAARMPPLQSVPLPCTPSCIRSIRHSFTLGFWSALARLLPFSELNSTQIARLAVSCVQHTQLSATSTHGCLCRNASAR